MAVRSLSTSTLNNNQPRYGRMSGAFGLPPFDVQYVVIAGGGSGATRRDSFTNLGGGGAGGYRSNVPGENSGGGDSAESGLTLDSGTYAVTIGAGGAGVAGTTGFSRGISGNNTTFHEIVSIGGGAGGSPDASFGPLSGGSGGGGGVNWFSTPIRTNGAAGTTGQGFAGGGGGTSSTINGGGGGGGAGGVGVTGTTVGGDGGPGVASSITGTSVFRGGGGGGSDISGTAGAGGIGGGGAGSTDGNGISGTANTGGGGGGAISPTPDPVSGAGGSGVIIFTVPLNVTVSFSAGVTQNRTVVGANQVFTVTQTDPGSTVTIG